MALDLNIQSARLIMMLPPLLYTENSSSNNNILEFYRILQFTKPFDLPDLIYTGIPEALPECSVYRWEVGSPQGGEGPLWVQGVAPPFHSLEESSHCCRR